MNRAYWLIAAALTVAPVAAARGQADTPAQAGEISKEEAEKALAQCGAKRFQTSAEFEVDGKMRRTGLRVCAQPGETDSAWIQRLEKAVVQVEAQPNLPQSAKAKLASDLRAEIARLKLRAPKIAPADALVATVPPMPKPLPAQPPIVLGSRPLPFIPPPRITVRCIDEGGPRDAGVDCAGEIRRDTILALEADEDLAAPTTVRFVRKGRLRGSVLLSSLRQGELVRMRLPRDVCKGVVRSQLEIEVQSGATGAGRLPQALTHGPYTLRC